jgi:hypothetical protein
MQLITILPLVCPFQECGKSFIQLDWVFESKVFSELENAQSIVPVYDEVNPWPASYCYLRPYYLDPNKSYFMQGLKVSMLSERANQTHLVFPGADWKIGERLTWSFGMGVWHNGRSQGSSAQVSIRS